MLKYTQYIAMESIDYISQKAVDLMHKGIRK